MHTDDVAQTVVDVNGQGAEEVEVRQDGDLISITAPPRRSGFFGRGEELDVHVSMPHDSRLQTKVGSADVTVLGRVGESAVRAGSGDVEIEQIAGEALVETGSGDVTLGRVSGDLRLKSGSGEVRVDEIGGSGSLSTGSGDIRVGAAHGAVQLKSGSADLQVGEAHQDIALSTASGDVQVDRIHRGELRANAVSGDILIGVPGGVPVWTDVSSLTGRVHSTLQGAGRPEEGQDYIELRAKTVSGNVSLEQV
ncbi:DUF4097 family beta strand repeat-containing protein [Nocardioides mesophilus]|uniref:DUF4097 family beta strand repeat protein n=1 Tax=Nocardioides mesophilus TaxID=433659 RepID=A0A7G9RF59_9ACTN|nr:DUF4097 family beta strand repeat-containing protein [Nocardioides mesophilus]QNN54234.1 DUF4097 family beta strand repeat protein [Nocardioides mesophilus]